MALSYASAVAAVLTTLAVSACAAPDASAGSSAHVVYLDFADGTTGVSRGEEDDAPHGISQLCSASSFARWEAPPDCAAGDRNACREHVLRLVREYFAAYAVELTLTRPSPPQVYTTVVIAPPHSACTFGQRGVAFADCRDANPANIAMVFDCHGDAAACAILVAHEAGHAFGLVHSADPSDIMTPAPEDPSLQFRVEPSIAAQNECGVLRQSSHDALLRALGARE